MAALTNGNARVWTTRPVRHTKFGVNLEDVESNPGEVFPNGPRPYISAYGPSSSGLVLAEAAAAGVTVLQTGGVQHNTSFADRARAYGLKAGFSIRDFVNHGDEPSSTGHGNLPDLMRAYRNKSSEGPAYLAMIRKYMDVILDDPEANDTVIVWLPYGDDALECTNNYYDGNRRKGCNAANPSSSWFHFTGSEFRNAYEWLTKAILDYDDVNKPGHHPNAKNRGMADIPFAGAYRSFSRFQSRHYAFNSSVLTHQDYWGILTAGANGIRLARCLIGRYWSERRKVLYAERWPVPPQNTGARNVAPTLGWLTEGLKLNPDTGITERVNQRWPNSLFNANSHRKSQQAETLIMFLTGSTGMLLYPYLRGKFLYNDGYLSSVIKPLHDANIFKALMWGVYKGGTTWTKQGDQPAASNGGVRREAVGGFRWWMAVIGGHPDGNGIATTLPSIPSAGNATVENYYTYGSAGDYYTNKTDALIWRVVQYKCYRYLVAVNCMPEPEEVTHLQNMDSNYPRNNPNTNTGELAKFSIRTKFHIPDFAGQMVCRNMITGAIQTTPGNIIDVTLNSYEFRIFRFEPAAGFETSCGDDDDDNTNPVNPVITTQPSSASIVAGSNVTFTVVARKGDDAPDTDVLQYQWYRRQISTMKNTEWVAISGATNASYTKNNIPITESGSDYRVLVRSTTGGVITSNNVALSVGLSAALNDCKIKTGNTTWTPMKELSVKIAATVWKKAKSVYVKTTAGWQEVKAEVVDLAPVITIQPQDADVVEGSPVSFTCDYTGGTSLIWQWLGQAQGATWRDIPGETGKTYSKSSTTLAMDDEKFRAVVRSATGKTTATRGAALNIQAAPPVPNPELVNNGNFDAVNTSDGWIASADAGRIIVNGQMQVTNQRSSYQFIGQTISGLTVSNKYRFRCQYIGAASSMMGGIHVRVNDVNGAELVGKINPSGTTTTNIDREFIATSTKIWIGLYAAGTGIKQPAVYDNVSLKRVG